MEIILIILTSTLIGAFLVFMFGLGFHFGKKYQEEKKVEPTLDEDNKEYVKGIATFFDYKGGK